MTHQHLALLTDDIDACPQEGLAKCSALQRLLLQSARQL